MALQFKKESGATINNTYLEGYQTNLDMKDNGLVVNLKMDGANASLTGTYNAGTKVDVSVGPEEMQDYKNKFQFGIALIS